ncbi:hypothetical protein [Pseudochrobactrum saccharolyticum]|uniref:hypothetical protein n=1 Tax=Pseudochrobactrum saccharolyticum TaxID=354352 RepID=UPI0027547AA8|nr:hypothetical protein [Pseudochrobactrum saccharolyticum]MDP8251681.1 hypothetical protein [Pseudochrobactrum saccharolyticum]
MKNRSGIAIAVAKENKSKLIIRSAVLSALTGLALVWGMSPSPAQDMQRYSMEKTEAGIIRLDRQTGEFALCKEQAGKIECAETKPAQLSSDERTVLLEKQVADLTARIARLEKSGVANSSLPSEEEFEKGLGYMERFMRSFMGVAKSLDEPAPVPNRT